MSDESWITIKNWKKHQHYGDRTPPWIKLHRTLLDDMEFRLLDPQYRALLTDLWLLASENGGRVIANVPKIAFRLHANSLWVDSGLKVLTDAGFISPPSHRASTALAPRLQDACLEKDKEKREEIEEITPLPPSGAGGSMLAVKRNGHPKRYAEVTAGIAAVMAEVATNGRGSLKAEAAAEVQAEMVFAYWAGKLGHEGAMLDAKRLARLKTRLQENGGNVHELLFVVDGTKRTPHLMGQNDRLEKYDGIQTIFRDREQVEKLAAVGGYKPGAVHPLAEKYAALVDVR